MNSKFHSRLGKRINQTERNRRPDADYGLLEPRQLLAGVLSSTVAVALDGPTSLVYNLPDSVPVDQRIELVRSHLELGPNETLRLLDLHRDELGFAHFKYQQLYAGHPVETAVYSVHVYDGQIVTLSGDRVPIAGVAMTPTVSSEAAFQSAVAHVGAESYAWELDAFAPDSALSALNEQPTGELVYFRNNIGEFELSYKFDIFALDPMSRAYVYVDANSGEISGSVSRIHDIDTAATGTSLYNGDVAFTADEENGEFRLRQAIAGVETYDMNSSYDYMDAVDFISETNEFTEPDVHVGVQAHWGTEQVFDYYFTEHNRNSFDNLGTTMVSYVSFGQNFSNAFWNGSFMTYGDGDGVNFNPLVSLDIVGHELTHGVTEFSAGLVYSYESGALNESFSDIFGKAVENHATGSNNWLLGDDIGVGGESGAIRNMENPNQFNDPDTYLGDFWWTNPGDNGGVHTNSGVQNKWFQLLTEGGIGVNDNGDDYDVTGIGIDEAGEIAYRNLQVYLTPGSQFVDARLGSIQAAIDLFGDGSPQQEAVEAAWDAVGVYGLQPPVEFITRVDALVPDGSMIYRTSKTNSIDGDLGVIYRIDLDSAQKMSLVLTGSRGLTPAIKIVDPANKVLADLMSQDSELVLQDINITTGGTYEMTVSSGGVDGTVTLDLWLNTALEDEGFDPAGASNGTIETAQNLESSAVKLAGNAQRMAVLGDLTFVSAAVGEDFETGALDQAWTTSSSHPAGQIQVSNAEGAADGSFALLMYQFDEGQPNLNEAIYRVDVTSIASPVLTFSHAEWNDETDVLPATFEGSVDGDGVSVSDDGINWFTVLTETNYPEGQWIEESVDLVALANEYGLDLGTNLQVKFQQFGSFNINADGRGYDGIRIAEGDTVAVMDGFESGALDQAWITSSSDPGGQILVTNAEGAAEGDYALLMYQSNEGNPNLNEAVYRVNLTSLVDPRLSFWHAEWNDETNVLPASFTGSVEGDGVSISDDGVNWYTILTGTDYPSGEWIQESFDLAALADEHGLALDANFQIKFQQFDNFSIGDDGRGYDGIQLKVAGSGADWYSFDLAQNQVATLAATGQFPGTIELELFDADGNLVRTGSSGSEVNSFVQRFVGDGATYYARLAGTTNYSLAVTRGADLDIGFNDTTGGAQDITGLQGALGFVAELDALGAEPDGAFAEDNISDYFPGVTLSNGFTGGDIFAAESLGFDAPTGDNVFAPAAFQASGFRVGVNELRADFANPQAFVSIDVGADDDTDVGFLRAYDVDGNFLEEVVSQALSTGESETLVITREIAEIAYIVAAGVRGDNTPFDNLIFELENFDEDVYSFEVEAGEEIALSVLLPGGDEGLFVNDLATESGPAITVELIDPNGFVVETENTSINYVSGDAGTYLVRIGADPGFSGEYFLFRDIEAGIVEPSGIDFGPPDSAVFEDYARVTDESYSLARGYGWMSTDGLRAFTDQRGGDLLGDKVAVREGAFAIDVDNGAYAVDVLFGAVNGKADSIGITVNGVEDVFRPAPGPNVVRSYPVNITDGQLNLEFTGAPGLDRFIRLAGIRLTPMDLRPFSGNKLPEGFTTTTDSVTVSAILPGRSQNVELDAFVSVIQPQKVDGFSAVGLAGSLVLDQAQPTVRDFGKNSVRTQVESLPGVSTLNDVLEEVLLDF